MQPVIWREVHAVLCSTVVSAAWLSSEQPEIWEKEEYPNYKEALAQAAETMKHVRATGKTFHDTGEPFITLPHHNRLKDLESLYDCAKALDEFRSLSLDELTEKLEIWVSTLAEGHALLSADSAKIQKFFIYLSRMVTPRPGPMCGNMSR